ncbi:MAG: GNAT family N-acetyltransferase [Burkholderiales bacterium]
MTSPGDYVAAETLKGGLAATVRALRPDDRERVARAVRGLERQSIYYRLFSFRDELTEAGLDRIMRFDPEREVVLLVTVGEGDGETVVGSGRYVTTSPGTAEVAFVVEEDYHGRGIASRLLRHLAIIARAKGIAAFEADALADNKAMQRVFARSGWPMQTRREGDAVHVTLALPDAPG